MFGHIDTVLIRWRDAFVAVPERAGGRERYIEVRGISDRDEAIKLGESLLASYAGTRGTTAVTGHVHSLIAVAQEDAARLAALVADAERALLDTRDAVDAYSAGVTLSYDDPAAFIAACEAGR